MKILIGLSGGVDSAVAAYLLKQQGYDITACFMRNWDSAANSDFLGHKLETEICPQEMDYNDAKIAAQILGIELLRVDFIEEYWEYVFSEFLNQYQKAWTPNPDILCNKYIKFEAFYNFALSKGYSHVATGHYARIIDGKLAKGVDENKDQSYFLCSIKSEVLDKIIFPIGEYQKAEIRKIAEEIKLNIATKKDSTGICFIGERNFRNFLQNYFPAQPGKVYDLTTRKFISEHIGVLYYTIGQRKGLNIGGPGGPYVVVAKDVENNILIVENQNDANFLSSTSCIVEDFNCLGEFTDGNYQAKFRYRMKDQMVKVTKLTSNKLLLEYPQGINAVTLGQYAVLYDGDICLGGGIISQVFQNQVNLNQKVLELIHEN